MSDGLDENNAAKLILENVQQEKLPKAEVASDPPKQERVSILKRSKTHYLNAKRLVEKIVSNSGYEKLIGIIILLNAILIGLETFPSMNVIFGYSLSQLSDVFGWLYLLDISLRIFALGRRKFFQHPLTGDGFWNWFDFVIVIISVVPSIIGALSLGFNTTVLRTFRLVRLFKIITHSPKFKRVLSGFIYAIPSMGSVILLMMLILFVGGVIATHNFGEAMPDRFGTLFKSMYSLFQVMTLEGWSSDMAIKLSETIPWAKAFFVCFILMTTFAVLNLLVALIVNSMQEANLSHEAKETRFENQVLRRLTEIEKAIASNKT